MAGSTELRSRIIDRQLPNTGGGTSIAGGEAPGAGPGIPAPGAPQSLRIISTNLLFSAVTPEAGATITWLPPAGMAPDDYLVQWATDAAFTSPSTLTADRSQYSSFGFPGLPVDRDIWVRVAARARRVQGAWSASATTRTPVDTVPPAAPTDLTTSWNGQTGNLALTWINPTSPNFRDVRIRVYASNGGTLLTDDYSSTGSYTWTLGQNLDATSSNPDPSVYIVLTSRSWGNVFSSTDLTGTATLAVPGNVTGATATWDGRAGACRFAWTVVAGVAGYRLTIDGKAYTVMGADYLYTLTQNLLDHSGTPDPALSWSLVAVDALGQVSATAASGTATLAPPATPAGSSHNWLTGADTASADWTLTWTQGTGIVGYRLTIDTLARDLPLSSRYHYPFSLNAQEHSGTADPALTWSLVAVDALGQISTTPASGTATNAAPPAPSAVAIFQLLSGFRVDVTAMKPADFLTYRYRIVQTSPAATDVTLDDGEPSLARNVDTPATYQVGVRQVDLFGQAGTEALSATLLVDALTLAVLRERLAYSDSQSTAAATLKAAMDDDVRGAGGVSYASNASWVRWVRADWQLQERIKTITLAMAPTSGTTTWYIRTSMDGATWSYFSGPVVATGGTGQSTTLTSQSSAANAQTNAVSSATLGNSANARIDLPTVQECRYVELWLRNTAASTRVDEFFPRRFVQADDVEAESIRAINIAAGAVTTDKMTIPGTASIDAALRLIAFRVPVSLDVNSGIYQGTGTFASPTTGLKIWNDTGIGRLATYNAGVVQVALDSAGALTFGAGAGKADASGLNIAVSTSRDNTRAYRFSDSTTSRNGLYSFESGSTNQSELRVESLSGSRDLVSEIVALNAGTGGSATARVSASNSISTTSLTLARVGAGSSQGTATFNRADVSILNGGLNVGTATGAAVGEIRAAEIRAYNAAVDSSPSLSVQNDARHYQIAVNGTSADEFWLFDASAANARLRLNTSGEFSIGSAAPAAGVRALISSTSDTNYPLMLRNNSGSTLLSVLSQTATTCEAFVADTAWTYSSDEERKEAIRPLEAGAVALLGRLAPKRFRYKADTRERLGFLAQEVRAVLPELVSQAPDGSLGLRTTDLIPILVAAVAELAARRP